MLKGFLDKFGKFGTTFFRASSMGKTSFMQSSDESSDSDSADLSGLTPYINRSGKNSTMDFHMDATLNSTTLNIKQVPHSAVSMICRLLDQYEKISIIFLIAEDYTTTISTMIKLLKNDEEFSLFLSDQIKRLASTCKLIEALCVIQNYEVLVQLGYHKEDLIKDFSPLIYACAIYIVSSRKLCYRVMECMTPNEEEQILESIKKDLFEKGIAIANYPYLEMTFAYLFEKGYVTDMDLSNLVKHFKVKEMDRYVDMLTIKKLVSMPSSRFREENSLNVYSRSQGNTDKTTANMGATVSDKCPTHVNPKKVHNNSIGTYPMNPCNPGVVLIIEIINFYEDFNEENKDLVIQSETALERRDGSEHDSERLKQIFNKFGFYVIHKVDLTHDNMLKCIWDATHNTVKENHSSFILIVLSHGQENAVIGCNSIPLNVNTIKETMNSKVLEGKPKILIIQACQGREVLTIRPDDIRTDGLSKPNSARLQSSQQPWQKHIFEFWSTVPGYVSFRSTRRGCWMIQILCDVLESPEYQQESFVDICTEVNRRLSNERWEAKNTKVLNVMLPIYKSTLDMKFILPPLQS